MSCLTGTNGYGPVRKFFFQLTLDGRQIAGNDQFTMLDLICNTGLVDKLGDQIGTEFTGRPGGQDGQTLRCP